MEFLVEHVVSMCTLGSSPRNKPMKQNVQGTFRNPEHLNSPRVSVGLMLVNHWFSVSCFVDDYF